MHLAFVIDVVLPLIQQVGLHVITIRTTLMKTAMLSLKMQWIKTICSGNSGFLLNTVLLQPRVRKSFTCERTIRSVSDSNLWICDFFFISSWKQKSYYNILRHTWIRLLFLVKKSNLNSFCVGAKRQTFVLFIWFLKMPENSLPGDSCDDDYYAFLNVSKTVNNLLVLVVWLNINFKTIIYVLGICWGDSQCIQTS